MLVEEYIYNYYAEFRKKNGVPGYLTMECADLVTWIERRDQDVFIPNADTVKVIRVVDGPSEVVIDRKMIPMERENKHLLSVVDRRIIDSYMLLRKNGVDKPSIIMYSAYMRYIYSGSVSPHGFNAWCCWCLMLDRLRSTCRIGVRFDRPDLFGPTITRGGGYITFDYSGKVFRSELESRGLIKKRTTKQFYYRST